MNTEFQPIDISTWPDLLRLAEEVRRSGTGRVLRCGEEDLALLMPAHRRTARPRRVRPPAARDPILDIIGIGASEEPSDIAAHKHEYLAEAFDRKGR